MQLDRPQRREQGEENIVPLINIVFLLLIFFMLTGTLEPAEPISVEPPETGLAELLEPDGVLVLIGRDGEMAVEGDIVTPAQLVKKVAAVKGDGVRIKADANSTAAHLLGVLNVLRDNGVTRVVLVTAAGTNE